MSRPELLVLPPELDPESLPRFSDRVTMAAIHRHYYGPQSPRSLQNWPLDWRIVNGRAVAETRAFLAEAQRRFDASRVIARGGQRPAASET
jgi:hypothetical protein